MKVELLPLYLIRLAAEKSQKYAGVHGVVHPLYKARRIY